ncbi:class I SAM-dependent methyltransferase [Desulfobulbus sp. F3]|nr:class I SAM-dependent methyltransferase [Desulfobulbus sp. F3]
MEPILRKMRIGRVLNEIKSISNCTLLDIGCGFNHKFLSTIEPYILHGTGIDFKVPARSFGKICTIQVTLNETLPFGDSSFDIATMLAVLEHFDKPDAILAETARILKDGGKLILTVPGKRAKPVLEFLAFQLGIVSRTEIEDHKKYYDLPELQELAEKNGRFKIVRHQHFQFGMNNFCVLKKI